MRAVWRASLQLEQVCLELLQALRRLGHALRGTAACDLICACHASQRSHYQSQMRRCAAGGVLHAAVLSAREHARAPGWRTRHMNMTCHVHVPAGARSVLPGSGVAPVRRRWSRVVRYRLSPWGGEGTGRTCCGSDAPADDVARL